MQAPNATQSPQISPKPHQDPVPTDWYTPWQGELLQGILLQRHKRFLADVRLASGEKVVAHCANSGSMKTCATAGSPVWLSKATNPSRKLRFTWELIATEQQTLVGVNTATPNKAVAHWLRAGQLPLLSGYQQIRAEVPYGANKRSRIDLLLEDHSQHQPECYVEIKNVSMQVQDGAAFPDAITERGQKHLLELQAIAEQGKRALLLYFLGRADCAWIRPADEIDPIYGKLLRQASQHGVEIMGYRMEFAAQGVRCLGPVPISLVA